MLVLILYKKCDYPLAAGLSNTPTQCQRRMATAYTIPIGWGIYLEIDFKYAKLRYCVTTR
ncbi:MAG: hypothetical protein EWV76_03940 [Microcystis novacekii Mn_MB_F_20050700_S1]|nr:MAG: hypothetical protein EWV76_03940 [Microcystis novacekii Mn_MB_F_20050700_S1]